MAQFRPLLSDWLSNKFESVQLETAKLITSFATANSRLVAPELYTAAISALQSLLTNIHGFTPEKIVVCNPELESLINDSNRNISTYAITTLLKTGTSKNISSLISTITNFIHDVSDDFKIIIIDAVRTLSLNFPQEWKSILNFLIDVLKNSEGGFKFKKHKNLIESKYFYDIPSLESKLGSYISSNTDSFATAFDVNQVRKFTEDEMKAINLKRKQEQIFNQKSETTFGYYTRGRECSRKKRADANSFAGPNLDDHQEDLLATKYADELLSIEQIKPFGQLVNSSRAISLTEPEAEFVVRGVKHLFKDNVVFTI
nr:CIH_HP1_G0043680.mRNA.1.CDS.1 [Saccharomyces cerevisiae]